MTNQGEVFEDVYWNYLFERETCMRDPADETEYKDLDIKAVLLKMWRRIRPALTDLPVLYESKGWEISELSEEARVDFIDGIWCDMQIARDLSEQAKIVAEALRGVCHKEIEDLPRREVFTGLSPLDEPVNIDLSDKWDTWCWVDSFGNKFEELSE